MGYVESAPLFCAFMETVKDMVNNTIASTGETPDHPLEKLMEAPSNKYMRSADTTKYQ